MSTTMTASPVEQAGRPAREGAVPPKARSRRAGRRLATGAVTIVLLAALVGGFLTVRRWARASERSTGATLFHIVPRDFSVVLKEKGELRAAKSTDVICEVEGRSTIISLIPEGSIVREGELLVELASNEIENRIRTEELKEANAISAFEAARSELDIQRDQNASDIRKAELQIELKNLELEKYRLGDWDQKSKDAQIAIDQAKISLDRRKQDFEAAKELYERKFITLTEYQESEFNYQKAIWDLEKAEKAKEVLENYTHVADLRLRESDLAEAIKEAERTRKNAEAEEAKKVHNLEGRQKELALTQDELAKLRRQKEKCRIFAPTQGLVVYYSPASRGRWMMDNEQIKEGGEVRERQVLMQLPDTSSMIVTLRIHEAKTDKLNLGQPVRITVEGIPGKVFTGKVTKIAAVADSQSGWLNPDLKEYETVVTLDPTDEPLKPGVTAHAEILVENVEDKLAVPVQTVFTKAGRRYVFRVTKGNEVEPVPVRVGAIGTEWAEIVEGIAEEDRILQAIGDDHRRLIPDAPTGPGRREGMRATGATRAAPVPSPGTGSENAPRRRGSGGPAASGNNAPLAREGAAVPLAPSAGQPAAGTVNKPAEAPSASGTR